MLTFLLHLIGVFFQIIEMHNDIGNEWFRFQQALIDAGGMLKKHKVCFFSMELYFFYVCVCFMTVRKILIRIHLGMHFVK